MHVVRNGIDTTLYESVTGTDALTKHGIDPSKPIVAFVGRITRQKGVGHLVAAAHRITEDAQLVLCAGAPDTPEIAAETEAAVAELAKARPGVFWIQEMLPTEEVKQVLSHATVFVCPSVYEPLGIVNLEAMACGTAVVASDVGGIPEVVDDGVTGLLCTTTRPTWRRTGASWRRRSRALLADPTRAAAMGQAGRERAVREFSWGGVAAQTVEVYRSVI
ncbi:glycosyltransferase [Kutzneria kofuensis]|uniref:glycosyltransferase n=1 Tax=Kutzneria kofuensis TaxID=103725 RepID=UPI0031EDF0D6